MDRLVEYQTADKNMTADQWIVWAIKTFGIKRIALASSFSIEDQVLTDMLLKADPAGRVFTLDTGRQFQETYDTWQKSMEHWKINYEVYAPDPVEVAQLISGNGPNHFYSGIEARKDCCAVRKSQPLKKVLSTVDAWIVGLRSEQAITRTGLKPVEWDEAHGIYRISPLNNWSEAQVWEYVKANSLPYNVLQEKGFRSVGCAPCTRAIGMNDDIRAGRWWWEAAEQKECGLHTRKTNNSNADGKGSAL